MEGSMHARKSASDESSHQRYNQNRGQPSATVDAKPLPPFPDFDDLPDMPIAPIPHGSIYGGKKQENKTEEKPKKEPFRPMILPSVDSAKPLSSISLEGQSKERKQFPITDDCSQLYNISTERSHRQGTVHPTDDLAKQTDESIEESSNSNSSEEDTEEISSVKADGKERKANRKHPEGCFENIFNDINKLSGLISDDALSAKFDALVRSMKKLSSVAQSIENTVNHPISQIKSALRVFAKCSGILKRSRSLECQLFKHDLCAATDAITVFSDFIFEHKDNDDAIAIESVLFTMAFSVEKSKTKPFYISKILPVFAIQDKFISAPYDYVTFKSSTGSGKTRCAPFFFAIRSTLEGMRHPFLIMTQKGRAIIKSKIDDFQRTFGKKAIITDSLPKMVKLYNNEQNSKPVIGIFSPFNVLKLISLVDKYRIFSQTRFCLDEAHERSIDFDVLVATLAKEMANYQDFHFKVLMMTATPDKKVIKCFGNVRSIELPSSRLFPVEEKEVESDNFKNVPETMKEEINTLIREMAERRREIGHILCFLSGINACQNLNSLVTKQGNSEAMPNVYFIKTEFKKDDTEKTFFKRVKKEILRVDEDNLIVLPIVLTGSVEQLQKNVAQDPLPSTLERNVIKLISATNIVESSITIEGLGAVVDSCLYKSAEYDISKGITSLVEAPITKSMQIQRNGRVGRTQKGIYISVSVNGHPLSENVPPSILREDLSISLISLRSIRIKLENIENLPDNPEESSIRKSKDELIHMGALSNSGEVTELGRKLSDFHDFSPFLSAAIISFKDHNGGTLVSSLFAALIIRILTLDSKIITNPYSASFRENYCKESDIVTIFGVILDVLSCKGKKAMQSKCVECGINFNELSPIYGCIQSILCESDAESFEPISELREFIKGRNLLNDIDCIIGLIENNKKDWILARKCAFSCVLGICIKPQYYFSAQSYLSFGDEPASVFVSERPGCEMIDSPKNCFVFSIERNVDMQKNYGFLIHRNPEFEYEDAAVTLGCDEVCNNPFFEVLLESYMNEDESLFTRMQTSFSPKGNDIGKLLRINHIDNVASISICPKSPNAKNKIIEAIPKIMKLMPYVPRSILINNEYPLFAMEIRSALPEQYESLAHFYGRPNAPLPYAYNLTRNVIDIALNNIERLSSSIMDLRFAVTGDSFIIQPDSIEKVGSLNIRTNLTDDSIFNRRSDAHLVLLSDTQLLSATQLRWSKELISASETKDDQIIQSASYVMRGIINASHKEDLYIFQESNSAFTVGGGSIPSGHIREELAISTSGPDSHKFEIITSKLSSILSAFNRAYCQGISLTQEIPLQFLCSASTIKMKMEKSEKESRKEKIKQIAINSAKIEKYGFRSLGNNAFGIIFKADAATEEKHQMVSNVINSLQAAGFSFKNTDVISISSIKVYHTKQSSLKPKKFAERIQSVVDRFGFVAKIIKEKIEYKPITGNNQYQGLVFASIIDPDFALSFAGEIKPLISSIGRVDVYFPPNMVSKALLFEDPVKTEVVDWGKKNGIDIQKGLYSSFSVPFDQEDLMKSLLLSEQTIFKSNYCAIPIPYSANENEINLEISKRNKKFKNIKLWMLNPKFKCIIVKKELEDEVKEYLSKFDTEQKLDLIGCFNFCDDPKTFARPITLYEKDGEFKTHNICRNCTIESLKYATSQFVQGGSVNLERLFQVSVKPEMIKFIDSQLDKSSQSYWPQIPIGQLIWLIADDGEECNLMIRAWITAILQSCLHSSPQYFTFCPDHPQTIFKTPVNGENAVCIVKGCCKFYCYDCKKWHRNGECVEENWWTGMRCPFCKVPFVKNGGCNHISCPCGKHWCYKCGAGFQTPDEVYDHLHKVHGGINT